MRTAITKALNFFILGYFGCCLLLFVDTKIGLPAGSQETYKAFNLSDVRFAVELFDVSEVVPRFHLQKELINEIYDVFYVVLMYHFHGCMHVFKRQRYKR